MTESTTHDTLISRYVDQTATPDDLAQLTSMAQHDASIWPRLHAAVSDHAALVGAIEKRTQGVDAIDLHDLPTADFASHDDQLPRSPWEKWSRWSGWGVAAAVALMWVGLSQVAPPTNSTGTSNTPTIQRADWSADEALNRYLEAGRKEGRILQELPKVLIRTQPTEDGKDTQIIYLRQFVERTTPSGFYGIQRDQDGVPGVVPVKWTQPSTRELY